MSPAASSTTTGSWSTTTLASSSTSSALRSRRAQRQRNYVEMVSATRSDDKWTATLRCVDTGEEFTTTASTIVNAAGPFVDETNQQWGLTTEHRIVYSKGIHLVVPRLTTTRYHQQGPRLLRRHRATLLRHPDGSPVRDRHHRHPRRHALHRSRRGRHRVPARARSTPVWTSPRRLTQARHHRASATGVRPLVVTTTGKGDQTDVDWTKLSVASTPSRPTRPSARRHDLRRQAHRLPQRGRRGRRRDRVNSACPARDATSTTGTASLPRRPAKRSSSVRPG